MNILKVGIIGYGLSGRTFHGSVISDTAGFKIVKIVTNNDEKKRQASEDHSGIEVVDDVKNLFEDDSIDLVVISAPNTWHFELAKQAMLAGKHVVVEKPFTVNSGEAEILIQISKETGCLLTVYHNRRFDGDFRTIQKLINEKKIGDLVEFESHFDRFRPQIKENAWREEAIPGSGILYDLGSHLIDQALCLFGLPREVYADYTNQRGGLVDDQFEIILYYDKLKVTLKSGTLVSARLPRFLLLGTRGSFVKYELDLQENELRNGNLHPWGIEPKERWGTFITADEERVIMSEIGDYRFFYENVYRAIVYQEDLLISGGDGLDVIKIIEAAILSQKEKRRIVLK